MIGLLEGLEASIVKLSELPLENPKLRLDSQFQSKEALRAISTIRSRSHVALGMFVGPSLKGRSIPYSEEGAFPVVRSGDISPTFDPDALLRSSSFEDAFFLQSGDILISSIGQGSIGKIQLFRHGGVFATVSEVTVVRAPDELGPVVAAFLSSKYGQVQIARYVTGATGQLHLYPSDVDRIVLPEIGAALRKKIYDLYAAEWESYESSREAQRRADKTIFEALGISNWCPPQPLSFTARASDSLAAGRMDAQYFRPLFEEVTQHLHDTGRAVELGSILTTNVRGRQPTYSDTGLPVINSKHVRANRVVLSENRTAIVEEPSIIIQSGDVLLNGTGVGTIGRAAAYLHSQHAVPDNHVTVLRGGSVDPIYLAAFLNSALGQWQIERHIRGSSGQVELYPNDIAKIVFWDAPEDVQAMVREAVLAAFREESRAQRLLELARGAIEIAVVDGESAAVDFLVELEGDG